jgi:hypothetical protein
MCVNHCSGLYAMVSAARRGSSFDGIERLVLYSFLAHPERLFGQTEAKMGRVGVRAAKDLFDGIPGLPTEAGWMSQATSVVHPTTPSSLARASVGEAQEYAEKMGWTFVSPSHGYELTNDLQREEVQRVCEELFAPVLRCASDDAFAAIPLQSPWQD